MIVDTSAVIAIIYDEPEAAECAQLIEAAGSCRMSAANWLEAAVVIDGNRDPIISRRFGEVVAVAGIVIEPVTEDQMKVARAAYRDFGKGSGHPAGLNFGDCFAYALAKSRDEPLLFKGGDFDRTDIMAARRSS